MDSDAMYAMQIDRKEAAFDRPRKHSRAAAAHRATRSGSAVAVLGVTVDIAHAHVDSLDAHVPVWETGLFTCWDASPWHCCLAVVLPCAIASHTEATIDRGSYGLGAFFLGITFLAVVVCATQSIDMAMHESAAWTTTYRHELLALNMWGIAACVAAAMYAAGVFAFRNMTRHYYRLPGSCCLDAVVATACAPCAMAQISRHFEKAGPSVYARSSANGANSSALVAVDTLPGYRECY